MLIFTPVGISSIQDIYVLNQTGILRIVVIFFYHSNKGVILLRNPAHLGLPIPKKSKNMLAQLHDKEGNDNESA